VGELAGEPVQLNNGDILEFGTLAICAVFKGNWQRKKKIEQRTPHKIWL